MCVCVCVCVSGVERIIHAVCHSNAHPSSVTRRSGFNKEGVRYDGTPLKYAKSSIDASGYTASGRDPAGYDRSGVDNRGLDRDGYSIKTGYNVYGVSRDGKLDGMQDAYNVDGRYNDDGYDRLGLDQYGVDEDGYGCKCLRVCHGCYPVHLLMFPPMTDR